MSALPLERKSLNINLLAANCVVTTVGEMVISFDLEDEPKKRAQNPS